MFFIITLILMISNALGCSSEVCSKKDCLYELTVRQSTQQMNYFLSEIQRLHQEDPYVTVRKKIIQPLKVCGQSIDYHPVYFKEQVALYLPKALTDVFEGFLSGNQTLSYQWHSLPAETLVLTRPDQNKILKTYKESYLVYCLVGPGKKIKNLNYVLFIGPVESHIIDEQTFKKIKEQ
jgi:hypothetical protein